MFQVLFQINKICPEISSIDVEEMIEDEGSFLVFDTRNIMNHIDLENLTSEEVLDIRSKLGRYQVFVQMKYLVIDQTFCTLKLYRVTLLSKIS